MRSIMAAVRRNLLNTKKSASRVADEDIASASASAAAAADAVRTRSRWNNNGVSLLCSIVLAPLSLFSCLSSHPRMDGPDGVWVSAELPQTSELTHLMVRDSLRYAILM